jgi:acyl-CoA reductase-like NAD-dependent aldehyde dehydrogenase
MDNIVCISPINGQELARRPAATDKAVVAALMAARAAQREWRGLPLTERKVHVEAFLAAMLAMSDEVVPELARQMGRPVRYRGEFRGFEERLRYMLRIAETALAPFAPDDERPGFRRAIKREPLGVVLVVAPWNYPYMTAINTVGPALIAGNAVLLKHAAQTLLVGERFQIAADRARFPPGLFQNLFLTHEQTAKILSDGHVDHCNFTGSVAAGRAIERAAAGSFTSLGLELGGKDPAYVRADADLDDAINNLVDGAFFNSGQCCCGIERIYVQDALYDRFVDGFVELTRQYRLADPLDGATTLGPMAHVRFADWVRKQGAEALAKGGRELVSLRGFDADDGVSAYLAPQVFVDVDHSMSLMREESFGPVVGIMKVKSDEEAISLMNDSPYGLTAAIWTRDIGTGERLGAEIETGTVFVNRCDYLDPGLVWTGVKDTGRGVGLSRFGFDSLTQPKSYHLKTPAGA